MSARSHVIPGSLELHRLVKEGQRLAQRTGKRVTTVHMLLAVYASEPNRAAELLSRRRAKLERILAVLARWGALSEDPEAFGTLVEKCHSLARAGSHRQVSTLHMLAALCAPGGLAYKLLRDSGVHTSAVRGAALGALADRPGDVRHAAKTTAEARVATATTPATDPLADDGEDEVVAPPAPPLSPPPRAAIAASPASRPRVSKKPPRKVAMKQDTQMLDRLFGGQSDERAAIGEGSFDSEVTGRSGFELDERRFPVLTDIGRNLTLLAAHGELEPAIGRGREVQRVLSVLRQRRAPNPLLVGLPGVGKTAVVEAVAIRVSELALTPRPEDRVIVEIPVARLEAGTSLRGAFAEKMHDLIDEVESASGRVVVFFDEIHTLVGAGGGDSSLDAGNILKTALAAGRFPCIGATTDEEYLETINRDGALDRRFTRIPVDEPSDDDAVLMVRGALTRYAPHHAVRYARDVPESAVRLARRYLRDRALPDSALHLIDAAGAVAHSRDVDEVRIDELAHVISSRCGIPAEKILMTEQDRLATLESDLGERVVGHEDEISELCRVIRRKLVGFASDKPIGSFLLMGPTGTGKTETGRALAAHMFDRDDALCRFDMSEYSTEASVNRLIGSAAGYVGHEQLSPLAEAVWRHPHRVLLFDEVEKAHPNVWQIFLQMLDEGVVTDNRGRVLHFGESIILMTTNLGAEAAVSKERAIGFGSSDRPEEALCSVLKAKERVRDEARKHLPAELWGRFDARLVYLPLKEGELARIAKLVVQQAFAAISRQRELEVRLTSGALARLLDLAQQSGGVAGARAIHRLVDREVKDAVVDHLVSVCSDPGQVLELCVQDEKFCVRPVEGPSRPVARI